MTVEEMKSYSIIPKNQIRFYLTGKTKEVFDHGYIGFHSDINEDVIDEICDLTQKLEEFTKKYFEEQPDYHFHSEKFCHLLSSIFCFSNSNWNLVQGIFDFKNEKKPYYHSWLESEEIIFDPAMNIVTLKSLYEQFFIEKYKYNQQQVIDLFKRTATFTYYEEDLENGVLNPMGRIFYDTKEVEEIAINFLSELNKFLNQKKKIKK